MYDIFVAVIIGVVQGITEFLPISSTAHNRLVGGLLLNGKDIGLAASNIIQIGTLVAIIQYFWGDLKNYWERIIRIITHKQTAKNFTLNAQSWLTGNVVDKSVKAKFDIAIVQLIIATVPIIILGFLLRGLAESYRANFGIGLFLILGALLMWLADWYSFKVKPPADQSITLKQVIAIGFSQCLAIMPGMSRSGSTISGAFLAGISREQAVRLSFLMSVPAVGIAGTKDLYDVLKNMQKIPLLPDSVSISQGQLSLLGIIIGAVASYYSGMLCLKWLLKYLSNNSFKWFIIYRIILGLLLVSVLR